MRSLGCKVEQLPLPRGAELGTFVPPTIIELEKMSDLTREVFGPVLHVMRYRREDLDRLIDEVNNSGYGLTFGLHTRLDETIEHVTSKIKAGNLYVNRNIIGAVVGVQPFGGRDFRVRVPRQAVRSTSGRLVQRAPVPPPPWLGALPIRRSRNLPRGWVGAVITRRRKLPRDLADISALGLEQALPGPLANGISTRCIPRPYPSRPPDATRPLPPTSGRSGDGQRSGNRHGFQAGESVELSSRLDSRKAFVERGTGMRRPFAGALVEGDLARVQEVNKRISALDGPLVLVQAATSEELEKVCRRVLPQLAARGVSTSINTARRGGQCEPDDDRMTRWLSGGNPPGSLTFGDRQWHQRNPTEAARRTSSELQAARAQGRWSRRTRSK